MAVLDLAVVDIVHVSSMVDGDGGVTTRMIGVASTTVTERSKGLTPMVLRPWISMTSR